MQSVNVTAAGDYATGPSLSATINNNGSRAVFAPFYLEPSDFDLYGKRRLFRLRAAWLSQTNSPNVSVTLRLYPVTSVGGTASAANGTINLGTLVPGAETPLRAVNAGSSFFGPDTSADFEVATAGWYALIANVSAAMAASSQIGCSFDFDALTR